MKKVLMVVVAIAMVAMMLSAGAAPVAETKAPAETQAAETQAAPAETKDAETPAARLRQRMRLPAKFPASGLVCRRKRACPIWVWIWTL